MSLPNENNNTIKAIYNQEIKQAFVKKKDLTYMPHNLMEYVGLVGYGA